MCTCHMSHMAARRFSSGRPSRSTCAARLGPSSNLWALPRATVASPSAPTSSSPAASASDDSPRRHERYPCRGQPKRTRSRALCSAVDGRRGSCITRRTDPTASRTFGIWQRSWLPGSTVHVLSLCAYSGAMTGTRTCWPAFPIWSAIRVPGSGLAVNIEFVTWAP